jgi:hypothetical protein
MTAPKPAQRTLPKGLKVDNWRWCDVYTGNRATLIDAQLAVAAQFPGEPGNGKTMVTFYRGERVRQGVNVKHDENYLQVARVGRRFKVTVGIPLDKQKERDKRADEQRQAESRRRISETVTPQTYLTLMADQVKRAAIAVATHTAPEGLDELGTNPYPYSLSKETWKEVIAKLDEVVEIIQASKVHRRANPALLTARQDGAFQKFLAGQCLGAE